MTTETISGKCPCCGYDKLIMYSDDTSAIYGIDGCVNCGFGVSDIYDGDVGFDEWKDYAIHLYSMAKGIDEFEKDFEDDEGIEEWENITFEDLLNGADNTPKYRASKKAYNHSVEILNSMDDDELRKKLFDWVESEERDDLYEGAVFRYNQKVIDKYRKKGVKIFKEINNTPDYKGFMEHYEECQQKGIPTDTQYLDKLAKMYNVPKPTLNSEGTFVFG